MPSLQLTISIDYRNVNVRYENKMLEATRARRSEPVAHAPAGISIKKSGQANYLGQVIILEHTIHHKRFSRSFLVVYKLLSL